MNYKQGKIEYIFKLYDSPVAYFNAA